METWAYYRQRTVDTKINTINKLTLMLNRARSTNDATPIRLNTQEIQDNV